MKTTDDSIVALDKFILSTRDSGYKSTSSAISELVDNSIQAAATHIRITIAGIDQDDTSNGLQVMVSDNGTGMDRKTLTQALRFGGSSRYNDRAGLGRFGMGLPNASLGQARRVTVYAWQNGVCSTTYLDVDEIASGELTTVPAPRRAKASDQGFEQIDSDHGCCVVWDNCDRLDNKRITTLCRKLQYGLGKTFRHYLIQGISISINDETIRPRDPLFLMTKAVHAGGRQFQDIWQCELYVDPTDRDSATGVVTVTFSELPVDAWHSLTNEKKRELGIANGAGVSIVRGDREVDFGWFFMGVKRRENYDDWWRCEVRFDPALDEAFGITHTKQQIKPKDYLVDALTSYMETTAKALNNRARQTYAGVKANKESYNAEQVAVSRDARMKPMPAPAAIEKTQDVTRLVNRHPALQRSRESKADGLPAYHIVEDDLADSCFFKPMNADGAVIGVINPRHQFHKTVYGPIVSGKEVNQMDVASALQLVFLAAARAELSFTDTAQKAAIEAFRQEWSHAMDVLLAKQ